MSKIKGSGIIILLFGAVYLVYTVLTPLSYVGWAMMAELWDALAALVFAAALLNLGKKK